MSRPAKDENRGDTPAQRLLWTPTEGQDLTKSYFPLSQPPVLAACDECGEEAPCRRDRGRHRMVCLSCIDKEAARLRVSRAPARLLRRP